MPFPFGEAEPEVNFIAHVVVVPKLLNRTQGSVNPTPWGHLRPTSTTTDDGVMLFEHIQHPLGDFVDGEGLFVEHGVSLRLRLPTTTFSVVKVPSELNCNCFHSERVRG
jgi:hypothetical protein